MKTIDTTTLKNILTSNKKILLIDVLDEKSFKKSHIPGSLSIPLKNNPSFIEEIEQYAASKDEPIVVYCQNTDCDLSFQAAEKLRVSGFTNVRTYEEGVDGWFKEIKQAA